MYKRFFWCLGVIGRDGGIGFCCKENNQLVYFRRFCKMSDLIGEKGIMVQSQD